MISMTVPQYLRRQCVLGGRKIRLVPMWCEALFHLLVAGPDQYLSRADLVDALWPDLEYRPEYAPKMVDICICGLRRHGVPIETYWGVGWRIPRFAREMAPAAPARLAA